MQPLLRTLQDHDLGHLRIVAELWGLELLAGSSLEAARGLASAMLDPDALHEVVGGLPTEAGQALQALAASGGRMPLADLTRRFGPLREIGAGRRDREKVWRQPASPLEALWYRGLLARAFADSPTGPVEMGFIPTDMLSLLNPEPSADAPLGRPAAEPATIIPADDSGPDDAVTLLAALRRRPSRDLEPSATWLQRVTRHLMCPDAADMLIALLRDLGLLQGPPLRLQARELQGFLALPRSEANRRLIRAWADSTTWNDLARVSGLDAAGKNWPNDPAASRQTIIRWMTDVPRATWWDLDAFAAQAREQHPGFQRPAGNFDSWYLRETSTGQFLRGFEHWDAIEGQLLRFVITGPLHWLGAIDLGYGPQAPQPTAFRTNAAFGQLVDGAPHVEAEEPRVAASLYPDGRVVVPRSTDRAHRYQIARWAHWDSRDAEGYGYRITPRALEAAGKQGLRSTQVLAILKAACDASAPDPLAQAIERAAARGTEARLQSMVVLRVTSPRLLDELRRRRATARYLGEALGRDAVTLRSDDWQALCDAAARLGLLIEPPDSGTHEPMG
ncbi:MAG: helicase-associated domain-containing protein [Chloroflexi bacterium]|nr:helicase-associated domain-containing protein [Chloroflexota bacterium]